MTNDKFTPPLDYADIRIAQDNAVLIAVDFAGLTSKRPVIIRKADGQVQILQDKIVRVQFKLPLPELGPVYSRINPDNEVIITQLRKSGKIQIFENITFEE